MLYVHVRVRVCACVCENCHQLLSMCETVPLTQATSFPFIDSGDVCQSKEAAARTPPSVWLDSGGGVSPESPAGPGRYTLGGTVRRHHCIWTVSNSAFLHLPPAPCSGAPCLSLIVPDCGHTSGTTPSMICLPSCCFSNTRLTSKWCCHGSVSLWWHLK